MSRSCSEQLFEERCGSSDETVAEPSYYPHSERVKLFGIARDHSEIGACTKYVLFLQNFFLLVAGIGTVAMTSYVLWAKEKRIYDLLDLLLDPPCLLCLGGVLVSVYCLLGSLGSLRENTCCLSIYYYMVWLALVAQLVSALLLVVSYYLPEVREVLVPNTLFQQAILKYRDDPDMEYFIDTLQTNMNRGTHPHLQENYGDLTLHCCGVQDSEQGFLDWNQNIYFNCSNENPSPERCSVPYSCCKRDEDDKINYRCAADVLTLSAVEVVEGNPATVDRVYTEGCLKALSQWLHKHTLVLTGAMLGVMLPEVIILLLTKNLVLMIRAQRSKW